jgi:hypothetical protein
MTNRIAYPIGMPGTPWGEPERNQWRATQSRRRRYDHDVRRRVDRLTDRFEKVVYGQVDYEGDAYALHALRSRDWNEARPTALVTGGVHGYETSGVAGALAFLETRAVDYAGKINLLVAPCVSPWGYERVHRWTYDAIDPNRSFRTDGPSREATALIGLVAPLLGRFLVHIDLHETTDSDESEFRPALAARDGSSFEPGLVPDGFYLVTDTENRQLAFQQAIIAAVERVTQIAPPDDAGHIIGRPVLARGVIEYPVSAYGMCAAITGARYTTTTEVYPDSPRATPQQCQDAQVVAVGAALNHALAAPLIEGG